MVVETSVSLLGVPFRPRTKKLSNVSLLEMMTRNKNVWKDSRACCYRQLVFVVINEGGRTNLNPPHVALEPGTLGQVAQTNPPTVRRRRDFFLSLPKYMERIEASPLFTGKDGFQNTKKNITSLPL
jgi:hypothetical protein